MFEDFKEKIREHSQSEQKPVSALLLLNVFEQFKREGIDPDNVTIKQLFSEVLDKEGTDLSLMSAAEMEVLVTYGTLREYFIQKYPQSMQPFPTHQRACMPFHLCICVQFRRLSLP